MPQFASMLQRGVLDRPVVDKTNLNAKYDFDLEWGYDDTQFIGNLPTIAPENTTKPDLFAALQHSSACGWSLQEPLSTQSLSTASRNLLKIDSQVYSRV